MSIEERGKVKTLAQPSDRKFFLKVTRKKGIEKQG